MGEMNNYEPVATIDTCRWKDWQNERKCVTCVPSNPYIYILYDEWRYEAYEVKENKNQNEFTVNNRCQF